MHITTVKSEEVWTSPDGKRTIWEVDIRGEHNDFYKVKTYSNAIATEGFSGEVRSYLSPRGDRFIRQVGMVNPATERNDDGSDDGE